MRPHAPRRILIINPFGIGDVLFTTPLIRAIRRAFPESHIAYLCNRRTQRILQGNRHVNEVLVYEKDELVRLWQASPWRYVSRVGQLVRRASRGRFDLVVDLSLGERYSFAVQLLGVPRRIGFDYRGRGRFLTGRLAIDGFHGAHVVEHHRELLRFMGIRLQEAALELEPSAADQQWARQRLAPHRQGSGPRVGLVPAGGVSWGIDAAYRRWNLEGFAAVGKALVDRADARVVLFGEDADRKRCQQVANLMGGRALDLTGETTLGRFVALLGQMDLVVCNDGGPLHIAVSQGVRTVSLFGPVDPQVYGPYPPGPRHRVVYRADLLCRPCYHRFKLPPCPYERACLTTIGADDVVAACLEVLGVENSPTGAAHAHDALAR